MPSALQSDISLGSRFISNFFTLKILYDNATRWKLAKKRHFTVTQNTHSIYFCKLFNKNGQKTFTTVDFITNEKGWDEKPPKLSALLVNRWFSINRDWKSLLHFQQRVQFLHPTKAEREREKKKATTATKIYKDTNANNGRCIAECKGRTAVVRQPRAPCLHPHLRFCCYFFSFMCMRY